MVVKQWVPIFAALMLLITASVFAGGCSDSDSVFPSDIAGSSQPSPTGVTAMPPAITPSSAKSPAPSLISTPSQTPAVITTSTPAASPVEKPDPTGTIVPIRADFVADLTDVDGPTRVEFTDLSIGEIAGWEWDLNGDGTIDSTEQNPAFYFDSNGDYSVTLTVTGPNGDDTLRRHDYIHVAGCGG